LRVTPEELTYGLEINKTVKERRARWDDGIGFQAREVFEAFLALPAAQGGAGSHSGVRKSLSSRAVKI
jgi:hypothetical protein